jgi:hypothetical protein
MDKKFVLAWLAVFVVWMGGTYLIHGMLLMADYGVHASTFRTAEDSARLLPLMIGATAVMAGAFVAIYRRGIENKAWMGQGARFGVLAALLTVVPWYTIYYTLLPLAGMLVVKQIAFDTLLCLVLGVTTAFLYKDTAKA